MLSGILNSKKQFKFNYGRFAIIKNQIGLNHYKLSIKDLVEKITAKNKNLG